MKVFLSYASKDRALAERVCRVLEAEGHNVFFDRDDLGGGDAFGERIRAAIHHAGVLVYLISQASVTPPSYALTELSVVTALEPRRRPAILPVRIDATPIEAVPAALRAYTILEPQGDVPAEIAAAIERLRLRERQRQFAIAAAVVGVLALGGLGYVALGHHTSPPASPTRAPRVPPLAAGSSTTPADTSGATPLGPEVAPRSTLRPEPQPGPPSEPPDAPATKRTAAGRSAPPADAVDAFNDAVLKRALPDRLVTLIGQPGNDGWSATLILVDQSVTKVHYRLDGDTRFTDTGSTDLPNPLTGQPRPNTYIQLGGAFWKPRRIDVKYTDVKGNEHGPFALDFDPKAQFLRFTKQALSTISWVTFAKPAPDKTLAYFTTLLSFKAAFREIRYSVDSDALNTVWPLKAAADGEGWPARLVDDTLWINLSPSARRVAVRLTFIDGSIQTKSFEVRP